MLHNEDRGLQIRIAELQADIEINLTACFGFLSAVVAVIIGLGQLSFTLSSDMFVEKLAIAIATVVLAVIFYLIAGIFIRKAFEARDELKKLRKRYVW